MKHFRIAAPFFALLSTGCAAFIWQDPVKVLSLAPGRGVEARKDARWLVDRRMEPDGKIHLALPDCVYLALSRNLTLKAAREERLKAQGDAFSAFSTMLPKVSVSGNYIRIDKGTTAEFGGMRFKLSPEDRYKTELSIQQPIFQGGAAYYAFEAARIMTRIAELGVASAEEQVAFAATVSFFDALLARASLKVARENRKLAGEHLENVRKRRKQGMASRFEELRAKTQVAGMEMLGIQAENQVEQKKLNLLRLLAFPLDSPVELKGAITSGPLNVDFRAALKVARRSRPDLAAAYLGILAQEKQIDAIRGQLMPKLYGFFTWGWDKPSGKSFVAGGGEGFWNGGVSLAVPLFDGGATHGRLLKAYAARRQAGYRYQDLQEEIALEIRMAILNLSDAGKAVEVAGDRLRLAREGKRLAGVGYDNGVNTQLDVLDADNALIKARYSHLAAIFGHIMAREALNRAMGIARRLGLRKPQDPSRAKKTGSKAGAKKAGSKAGAKKTGSKAGAKKAGSKAEAKKTESKAEAKKTKSKKK